MIIIQFNRRMLNQFLSQYRNVNQLKSIGNDTKIKQLISQLTNQSITELYSAMIQMQTLIQNQAIQPVTYITLLEIIKQMIINFKYQTFILLEVLIMPSIVKAIVQAIDSTCNKQASNKFKIANSIKKDEHNSIITNLVLEIMIFFYQNLKFVPFGKYKIKTLLSSCFQRHNYKYKEYLYFSPNDIAKYKQSYSSASKDFNSVLRQTLDFLSDSVEDELNNSQNMQKRQFILGLVKIGDSYSIGTVIQQICSFFHNQTHINQTIGLLDDILKIGQIQSTEMINIKCIPLMMEYILPLDFQQKVIFDKVKYTISLKIKNKILNYIYKWYSMAKMLGTSLKIYQQCFKILNISKNNMSLKDPQLKQFTTNIQYMAQINDIKKVILNYDQKEMQIIKILIDYNFLRSNDNQSNNILDQLTISEQQSKVTNKQLNLNSFSQSLLKSTGQQIIQKKLAQQSNSQYYIFQDSAILSNIKKKQGRKELNQIDKRPNKKVKQSSIDSRKRSSLNPSQSKKINVYQSERLLNFSGVPLVASPNYHTPSNKSTPKQISIHSSQFSQKQNNNFKVSKIKSVYLNQPEPQKVDESDSGQFVHFEKHSSTDSQKINNNHSELSNKEIQFNDSLPNNINKSETQIQYGINENAKIPKTIKKPKFSFKNYQTNQSSVIAKQVQSMNKMIEEEKVTNKKDKKQSNLLSQGSLLVEKLKDSNDLSIKHPKFQQKLLKNDYGLSQKFSRYDQINSPHSIISQIKQNSANPNLISQSLSLSSEKIPNNFGSVFKKRVEKASVISPARSIQKQKSLKKNRDIQIADLHRMRELQNQLGNLKIQTQNKTAILSNKKKQVSNLVKQRQQLMQNDPYALRRQNEIIKILIQNKQKGKKLKNIKSQAVLLSHELKESTIRNSSNLKDYPVDKLKFRLSYITGYLKQFKKNIISSRCILLKNQIMEVGYSFKAKYVTLYFTLKTYCEKIEINLQQNSIEYEQPINQQFNQLLMGKQIKFKTKVKDTNNCDQFNRSILLIKVKYEYRFEQKQQTFRCELPLTPYNLARPITLQEANSFLSNHKYNPTPYKTILYNSCEELITKSVDYLKNLFLLGVLGEQEIFSIAFEWKDRVEIIRIKLKQRSFILEGEGYPLETGKLLIEDIVNLLVQNTDKI